MSFFSSQQLDSIDNFRRELLSSSKEKDELELEVRFFRFLDGNVVQKLDGLQAQILKNALSNLPKKNIITREVTHRIEGDGDYRKIEHLGPDNEVLKVTYLYKKELKSLNLHNHFGLRVVFSREKELDFDSYQKVLGSLNSEGLTRFKNRVRYNLCGQDPIETDDGQYQADHYYLDLTVTEIEKRVKHELELEVADNRRFLLSNFSRIVEMIVFQLHHTDHLITLEEKRQVLTELRLSMGLPTNSQTGRIYGKTQDYIDSLLRSRANLHPRDELYKEISSLVPSEVQESNLANLIDMMRTQAASKHSFPGMSLGETGDRLTAINKVLNLFTSNYTLDPREVSQSSNLKMRDLKSGGLVPIRTEMKHQPFEGSVYSVTLKADGVRKFMIVLPQGLFLVAPRDQVHKLATAEEVKGLSSIFYQVMEGEFILKKDLKSSLSQWPAKLRKESCHYIFLAYDCLGVRIRDEAGSFQVNQTYAPVTHRLLKERTEYLERAATLLENRIPWLYFQVKESHTFFDANQFFSCNKRLLETPSWYPTDGLVYTSLGSYVLPQENKESVGAVVCRKIFKWKPVQNLTIDFIIQRDEENNLMLISNNEKPFFGTHDHPFDPETMIHRKGKLDLDDWTLFDENTIIEMGPVFLEENGEKLVKLEAIRIREDKIFPNNLEVANDVWLDIHLPIDEDVLKGQQLSLLFRYHNRVKDSIYDFARDSLGSIVSNKMICVGSGKGGDVRRWLRTGIGSAICVEPDENKLPELRRRLDNSQTPQGMMIDYDILPIKGQEIGSIRDKSHEKFGTPVLNQDQEGGADLIVYMLSLSFFQPAEYEGIMWLANQTLRPEGLILIFTIDGEKIIQSIQKTLELGSNSSSNLWVEDETGYRLKTEKIVLEYRKEGHRGPQGEEIYVHLPGAKTVGDEEFQAQFEYLTYPQWWSKQDSWAEKYGLTLVEVGEPAPEFFLNPDELIYSQFFTRLIWKKK